MITSQPNHKQIQEDAAYLEVLPQDQQQEDALWYGQALLHRDEILGEAGQHTTLVIVEIFVVHHLEIVTYEWYRD